MIAVELLKDIYHVQIERREELALTFLRFQEHYQSREFRGKTFTYEQFRDWYMENAGQAKRLKRFTYIDDFSMFDFPSPILDPFYEGDFDPLPPREKKVLELFRQIRTQAQTEDKLFYVTGTSGSPHDPRHTDKLKHVIGHALYYLEPGYREEVDFILDTVGHKIDERVSGPDEPMRLDPDLGFGLLGLESYIMAYNYHPEVWKDEMHAFLLTKLDQLKRDGLDIAHLKEPSRRINEIFEVYFSNRRTESEQPRIISES